MDSEPGVGGGGGGEVGPAGGRRQEGSCGEEFGEGAGECHFE